VSGPPIHPGEARRIVLAEVVRTEAESVGVGASFGRVVASPVASDGAAPPFDNSAMDGFAVRSEDTAAPGPQLRLVGESRAGAPAARPLGPGEAVRISTGALLPAGADAVVPVEQAAEAAGCVTPARVVDAGAFVRRAGEDFAAGTQVLAAGRRVGAAELGVLGAAGVTALSCARTPRVAVLTSGDELVPPGSPLGRGQIHDASSLSLPALAREAGASAEHLGRLPDDTAAAGALISTAQDADLLAVAGGVSVGRHDHVKQAFADLGVEQRFWRVAMRPGGPTWFGVLPPAQGRRPTLVFGLPGNPVSSLVTFRLFAWPALLAMVGLDSAPRRVLATLAEDFEKPAGKVQFLRCRLEGDGDGRRVAHLTRRLQASHVLTSMLGADGLVEVPLEVERVAAGERVEVELLW
jgi:molybdopterin molybdotransferase